MNHLFAIISIGAALALIMMGGIGITASHTTQEAIALSNIDNNNTTTLGNPFFVEEGTGEMETIDQVFRTCTVIDITL
jgi:hypothetical protein